MSQILEHNRTARPDRIAVVDEDRSLTWAEFDRRIRSLAGALIERGVRPADRVAVVSHDRVEVLESYFALAAVGAVFVPVNHSLTEDEIHDILTRAGVSAVLGESAMLRRIEAFAPPSIQFGAAYEALAARDYTGTLPDVHYDDIMALLHTSATTGRPKAVVLSHRSLMRVSLGWLSSAAPDPDMVMLNCCPLFHGSFGTAITYLAAGATVVLMPGFTPQRFLHLVPEHRVTHVWAVPEMLAFLLRTSATQHADLSSLREISYGAAPMPIDLYRQAALTLGCGFRQVYGMTEIGGSLATLAPREHPDPGDPDVEAIPTGRPVLGMSVVAKGPDGEDLPPGEVGEICVRGDDLMRGYWRDPAATAEIMRDGWLRTGDLGRVDEHGLIWITDRLKDVVIRGGQNVYPAEIERVLRSHAAVADAAVVAVPDPDWGQAPLAFVVADSAVSPGELNDELYELISKQLAAYKRPREIRFVPELPRTPSGKILKRVLREQALTPEPTEAMK